MALPLVRRPGVEFGEKPQFAVRIGQLGRERPTLQRVVVRDRWQYRNPDAPNNSASVLSSRSRTPRLFIAVAPQLE